MVLPIKDENTQGVAEESMSNIARTSGVDSFSSPALNIPKEENNYHWFLTGTAQRKPTISPKAPVSLKNAIGGSRIRAGMSIRKIVNSILGHIGY